MRILLTFLVMVFATVVKAQTLLGTFQNNIDNGPSARNHNVYDSNAHAKWFINSYTGITSGYSFFHTGGAGFFAAPVGLQLNRRLSNNVYAFAGATVAPMYIDFNHAFLTTGLNKINTVNSLYRPGSFSMYSAATLGLMYINDQKTFSVSGSIGVERSSYPLYYNNQWNTMTQTRRQRTKAHVSLWPRPISGRVDFSHERVY